MDLNFFYSDWVQIKVIKMGKDALHGHMQSFQSVMDYDSLIAAMIALYFYSGIFTGYRI